MSITTILGRVRIVASIMCWLCVWAVPAAAQWGLSVRDAPTSSGAEITAVAPGSPGAVAGLRAGDVVVKLQGVAVTSAAQLALDVQAWRSDDPVVLTVSRQGWEKEVRLAPPPVALRFGIAVKDAGSNAGATISAVSSGSPAADAELRAGDRIVRVDGRAIADAAQLRSLLGNAASKGQPLTLTVERAGWGRKDVALSLRPAATPQASAVASGVPSAGAASANRSEPAAVTPPVPSTAAYAEMDEANRQYDAGNWREAELRFRRALEGVPDEPRIWGRLCHAQVMQDRFAEAVETCRHASELAPREPTAFQNMAYGLSRLARHAEAIEWYRKAIDVAPDRAALHEGIGAAYAATGNWPAAEEHFRLAVVRDPKSASAWQGLGDACGEQRKPDDAIAAYRRAVELGATNARVYRSLGWHLYGTGRFAEAEQPMLEANRLNPKDAATLVSLGLVEEKLGKSANAKQAWQRAVELDPNGASGTAARQNLAALETRSAAPMPAVTERAAMPPSAVDRAPVARGTGAPPTPLPPQGERAMAAVAIGDFQVKAANAGQYVGDGLREMLLTALHQSGNFVVVERMDLKGLAAEQALSRSRMARPGEAVPEGQMEVADIMIYGAVTEFEPEIKGGGFSIGMGNIPLSLGVQTKAAHMAIDVRIVDVASGRVLATGRLAGEARSAQTSVGVNIQARGATIPASLGGFQNTPMEQAIRDCIGKATTYIAANTPGTYFHHH